MKDDKSKLKFISIISGLIIAIIAGYFGGISSGFHLYEIQKRELEKDIIARFILNDNYNISVACNILSAIKNEAGLPLFYYNTKTYKDDYHVVLISERYDIEAIQLNLIEMDLSNNFVLAGLQNLELSKKIRPILKDYSEKIIKRIIEHDHNYKDYVCKDKNGIEILNNDNSNDEAN